MVPNVFCHIARRLRQHTSINLTINNKLPLLLILDYTCVYIHTHIPTPIPHHSETGSSLSSHTLLCLRIPRRPLLKQTAGFPPQSSWLSLQRDPRICISNEFPGDADVTGSGTTFWEPLL